MLLDRYFIQIEKFFPFALDRIRILQNLYCNLKLINSKTLGLKFHDMRSVAKMFKITVFILCLFGKI